MKVRGAILRRGGFFRSYETFLDTSVWVTEYLEWLVNPVTDLWSGSKIFVHRDLVEHVDPVGQQTFLGGHPGLPDLEESSTGADLQLFQRTDLHKCLQLTDLEWFAHSDDALQDAAEVTQHAVPPSHGDLLFTDENL